MTILYAPFKLPDQTAVLQQQPRQGMYQPDFYLEQQQQQQAQGPTSADLVAAQLQRIRQRAAPAKLDPGARVTPINSSVADPSNFQSYYKQLSTIKQIGQEQVAKAQAEAALAQIRASQALNQINAANPQYKMPGAAGPAGNAGGRAGSAVLGNVPSNPRANFAFAQGIAGNYGWNNPGELGAWYQLGMKESGWNNNAQNKTSTAYGIGQFLNSTWGGYGIAKTSDPAQQVEAMARYIRARYGSPSKALAFHIAHNWY